jgi:hypothetical protein
MREGGFENAKALSEAAGFSNYHNYHPYADFDNWLNNDQAVVITLNQEDRTFYALYRASRAPGGDLETTANPVQQGDLASLTAQTISALVSSFDKALVFTPKPSPAPQAGQSKTKRIQLTKGERYRVAKEGSRLVRWEPHPSGGMQCKRIELPIGCEITFLGQGNGPGSDPGFVQSFSYGTEIGDFWPTTTMGLGIEVGWLETA